MGEGSQGGAVVHFGAVMLLGLECNWGLGVQLVVGVFFVLG